MCLVAGAAVAATDFGAAGGSGANVTSECGNQTFTPTGGADGTCVAVLASDDNGAPAGAPVAGVVTSWSFTSAEAQTARLRILHDPAGTASSAALEAVTYAGISAYVPIAAGDTPTFKARLPIATEAGATFQCSVDGSVFAACSSPFTTTGKKGAKKHTFAVRALDALGNIDLTPATGAWKVTKKKPRKARRN